MPYSGAWRSEHFLQTPYGGASIKWVKQPGERGWILTPKYASVIALNIVDRHGSQKLILKLSACMLKILWKHTIQYSYLDNNLMNLDYTLCANYHTLMTTLTSLKGVSQHTVLHSGQIQQGLSIAEVCFSTLLGRLSIGFRPEKNVCN